MTPRRIAAAVLLIAVCCLSSQCGSDEGGPTQTSKIPTGTTVDTIPPAAISDLVARTPTVSAVYLIWTAPGDDGDEGTAASYDVRYHDTAITEQNWDAATQFDGEPPPKPAKQLEMVRVSGLAPLTPYFFAVKTTDDEGNESGLSNSDSMMTSQESAPPAPVTDLEAVAIDEHTALLTWTAPGDDGYNGTASQYEIRRSTTPITASTWPSATAIPLPPSPKPSGEPESLLVSGLSPMVSYHFAMKAADEVPNWSNLSNVAYAMGYSVKLVVSSNTVQVGDDLTIRFRAPGGQLVAILLNQYGIQNCDPSHPWVRDAIEPGRTYAEGLYEIIYDFKTPIGDYLPPNTYYVVLCWDFDYQTSTTVHFVENY